MESSWVSKSFSSISDDNLYTNLIMETCEVTFDETQPCSSFVFKCAGDDEVGKMIFKDEEDDAGVDTQICQEPTLARHAG
jgi:hypothetical protein